MTELKLHIAEKQALAESPLFRSLTPEWLDRVWKGGTMLTEADDSLIIPEDDDSDFFHVILRGRVKLTRTHPETGRSVILFLLGAGDAFDVVNFLDEDLHTVAATAVDEAVLLRLPKPTVRGWFQTEPGFSAALLSYLGNRMNHLQELAADYALYDTGERLGRLILRHIRKESGNWTLDHLDDLTHDEIAEMVGSVRAVINRQLQHLKHDGILEIERKSLRIKNLEGLIRLCG